MADGIFDHKRILGPGHEVFRSPANGLRLSRKGFLPEKRLLSRSVLLNEVIRHRESPYWLNRIDHETEPLSRQSLLLFPFRSILGRMAATRRRYPPPWQVEERPESFIVKDGKGQPLAYIYFEEEPQRQMTMRRIGKDDAWQLARAITRIPGLLHRD
jgi:hypothetical protein